MWIKLLFIDEINTNAELKLEGLDFLVHFSRQITEISKDEFKRVL